MADFPVFVDSGDTSSERRLSPAWTVATLKKKLWPITGISPENQVLSLRYNSEDDLLSSFNIEPLSVLTVADSRPKGQRENYTDDTNVQKFELTDAEYEARNDSVLAFKKRNQIGRFDPNAGEKEKSVESQEWAEVEQRNIIVGKVPEIPKPGVWVGIEYDEPIGKNDGSLNGVRYFKTGTNYGGFLKPVRIEVGDFPPKLDDDLLGSDDEI